MIKTPASRLRAFVDDQKGGKRGELLVVVLVRKLKPSSRDRMQQLQRS